MTGKKSHSGFGKHLPAAPGAQRGHTVLKSLGVLPGESPTAAVRHWQEPLGAPQGPRAALRSLGPPGSSRVGSVWGGAQGLLPPSAGFSSVPHPGQPWGGLGAGAVVLWIPGCVFHGSLCAASGLWLGLLILWEGTESPLWGYFGISALCGTGCVLLRDWQHKESLGKGRKAQRGRGTSSSFS